jgi:hypothetical protein
VNRVRTVGLLLALALLSMTGGPAAAQYPPSAASVEVSATSLPVGGSLTIVGEGWQPNSVVRLSIFSPLRSLGSVRTDDSGAFSITVTLPEDLPPGPYTLRAIGIGADGRPRTVDTLLVLTAAAPEGGDGSTPNAQGEAAGDTGPMDAIRNALAATGLDAVLLTTLGLAALVVGSGLIVVVRRRDRSDNVS